MTRGGDKVTLFHILKFGTTRVRLLLQGVLELYPVLQPPF